MPAFAHMMGQANWWAPKPLARLHGRVGITEAPPSGDHLPVQASGGRHRKAITDA